jgi:cyclopropane-fatty-acyl-phospholipid synthase
MGQVEHQRYSPVRHRLRYRLYVYAFDLNEIAHLDRTLPLFGYNRRRPVSLHDRDYLVDGPDPISDKLRRIIMPQAPEIEIARVVMVTSPRYFNYVFNPVSFYYCFDNADRLVCAVAEVNNTFGEKHVYVLPMKAGSAGNGFPVRFQAAKAFHVSPFNTLDGTYHFYFADIHRELDIRIALHREGQEIMNARLWGQPRALTAGRQIFTLLRHPIAPHLTIPRIYWQALRLKVQRGLAYHDKPVPASPMTIRRIAATPFQRRCAAWVLATLAQTRWGEIALTLPDGGRRTCRGSGKGPRAAMQINDHRFFVRVVLGGDIGFGEAFMHGEWDSQSPVTLLRFFIRNRDVFADGRFKSTLANKALDWAAHLRRRNTLRGSRRNIRRHYDLSNDFFRLFLDASMAYSCGIFPRPEASLEEAQQNKFATIIRKARLTAADHVLEIGCGWGGFAMAAVRQTGCRVTGITVSRAQYSLARERVAAAGLSDRITIRLADYRRVRGIYDKIVSIEMLEAVGHAYYGRFFRCLDQRLKPHGIAVIQTISIPDPHYARYRKECDWIQKHIFPGGQLPCLTVLTRAMTRHSHLMVEHLQNIGDHYALTLAAWRERFLANQDRVAAMGFDDVFRRKWLYYLASCEAGFRERVLGDLQLVLTREGNPNLSDFEPWS